MRAAVVLALVAPLAWMQGVRGDNWPNWRGPAFDGTAAGSGYVAEWGPEKHVLWKVPLPERGTV